MHSLFDRAVAAARQLRASDIHLKPGLAPILRIHGELKTLQDIPPLSREFIHSVVMSLLNDRRREILERTGDVTLSMTTTEGRSLSAKARASSPSHASPTTSTSA